MGTKFYDRKSDMWIERDTPIIIPYDNTDENRIYYCKYCNRSLTNINNEEYFCTTCNVSHFPASQDIRAKSKILPHDGPVTEPLAAYPPDPNAPFHKKKVQYKDGFKVLSERRTLKILDYREYNTKGSYKIQTIGKKREDQNK